MQISRINKFKPLSLVHEKENIKLLAKETKIIYNYLVPRYLAIKKGLDYINQFYALIMNLPLSSTSLSDGCTLTPHLHSLRTPALRGFLNTERESDIRANLQDYLLKYHP
jgi:hypothetical protein